MVNINADRSRVECANTCEFGAIQKCETKTKNSEQDVLDFSVTASRVSYNMWKDKFGIGPKNPLTPHEKLTMEVARWVGYNPERYSKPFKGRTRDYKAVITAVRFKQIVLKRSSHKRSLMKEAILANTMRRAEEDILIRNRQRQLRRAQAVAEARAVEQMKCSNEIPGSFVDDDVALQSLENFMQSLSSVNSTPSQAT